MALIATSVLLDIADRAASQFSLLNTAFASINPGGDQYADKVTATDNIDLEVPSIAKYDTVDNSFSLSTNVGSGTPLGQVITAMDAHFSRVNSTGSWDGYLTTNDIRVSDFFNQINQIQKGSFLLSNNVFSEAEDIFGTVAITAGPTLGFVDGISYGDGAATNKADGTNFAAQQMRVKVVNQAIGAADLDIDITYKDENNTTQTISVVIPATTAQDAFINVGTSSNRALDVTGVVYTPASDEGTDGDDIEIQNLKERAISF